MAASSGTLAERASVVFTSPLTRRRASDLAEVVARLTAAAGDIVLFVWTVPASPWRLKP